MVLWSIKMYPFYHLEFNIHEEQGKFAGIATQVDVMKNIIQIHQYEIEPSKIHVY